jgi:hypothetical protein
MSPIPMTNQRIMTRLGYMMRGNGEQAFPQGLKPLVIIALFGTTEVVP